MRLKNYEYFVRKYFNKKGGISIYKLENSEAIGNFTIMDEGTDKMSFGVASFKLKNHFMKGWILDGLCPYEFMESLCREHSDKAIAAITEADKVVDDLLEFKLLVKNAPERIKVDEFRYPPEKK